MEDDVDRYVQILPADGIKQSGMFGVGLLPNGGQTVQFGADRHHRRILKRAHQRHQPRVVGGFVDTHVELAIELDPCGRSRRRTHRVMEFLSLGDDFVSELWKGELEQERLEPLPDLVDLPEVVLVELGNDRAAVGIDDDPIPPKQGLAVLL